MTALTVADFLLARIAEDEAAVVDGGECRCGHGPKRPDCADRLKAECEAKRRIVDRYAEALMDSCSSHDLGFGGAQAALLDALHYLALPYADHPDYRDEWRP